MSGYWSLRTSESVTEGHPDKLCDQISDAILDAYLTQDRHARVACETVAAGNAIWVHGEITSTASVDIEAVVRGVVRDIGYTDPAFGLDATTCVVTLGIRPQAPEIGAAVDRGSPGDPFDRVGAGDQGIVFGYATDETPSLMPMPIELAHALARRLAQVRKDGILEYLRPDGKTQVTVGYDEHGAAVGIDGVVISAQHDPGVAQKRIEQDLRREVIEAVLPADLLKPDTRVLVNPSGAFTTGGPTGDTGLTGRKVIVDTYGGEGRHGGGCFSGKDPTKVDRSGAYAARQAARWLVAIGHARRAEVSLAYAIGVARPLAVGVDTFGTATRGHTDAELGYLIRARFDLRPAAIIERMGLCQPIYRQVAAYGHFGRPDLDLPWEQHREPPNPEAVNVLHGNWCVRPGCRHNGCEAKLHGWGGGRRFTCPTYRCGHELCARASHRGKRGSQVPMVQDADGTWWLLPPDAPDGDGSGAPVAH